MAMWSSGASWMLTSMINEGSHVMSTLGSTYWMVTTNIRDNGMIMIHDNDIDVYGQRLQRDRYPKFNGGLKSDCCMNHQWLICFIVDDAQY